MSRITFRTDDNKLVIADPEYDICLYYAPRNPPNTGTKYTRGIDYYVHKARSGKLYFYAYSWSMWQGDYCRYILIPENEAKNDLQTIIGREHDLSENEIKRCLKIWPDFLEETA
ncbi:MAG: hypothetical protein QXZ12_06935 [Thermoplasmata archaeon]